MSVARDIARFVTGEGTGAISVEARDYAAMLIASTIASAAAGSSIHSAQIIRELAARQGGASQSSLWFNAGPRIPATLAARANAVMSDAAAADDTDLRNIVHPGTPLVATSLALAEQLGSSGETVLNAIVLGYEAQYRIGSAATPGFRQKGFHGCIIAVFGSTVAAGHLLGLDEEAMTHAIALTATSIGGMMAAANTSVAREYHAGLATMLGIEAALAAQAGFTAEEHILEMPRGFIDLHGGGDPARATGSWDGAWGICREIAVKLIPGAHQLHASAEAAAQAAIAGNVRPEEIDRISISRPDVSTLSGPVRPASLVDMAHSAAYFVAAAAADREFSWQHASMEKIQDPVIGALCERVVMDPPPPENQEQYREGATVTITTKAGRSFSHTVYVARGTPARGLSWADIDAKYRALFPLSGLSAGQMEQSLDVLHVIADEPEVRHLLALLQPMS